MRTLYGRSIAERIHQETRDLLAEARKKGKVPQVVALSVGKTEETECYLQGQQRTFGALGIGFERIVLPEETDQDRVLEVLEKLNGDERITGIVVALPLPQGLSARKIQSAIRTEKDIEGVTPESLGMLASGNLRAGPATAEAVMALIDIGAGEVKGKEAVVVGHSEIVGKPVALHLLERLATVTVCHIGTKDLKSHTRRAEILVVAVGKPGIIKGDMLRPGVMIVDVGINRTLEAGKPKIVGDVDLNSVCDVAEWVTPVPGGVGPVTRAILGKRAVWAALSQGPFK